MSAEKETCQACERGKYKTNVGAAKFGMCQSCTVNQFTDDEASVSAAYCSIRTSLFISQFKYCFCLLFKVFLSLTIFVFV